VKNVHEPKVRVFVSYSRKDRDVAETLRDRLLGDGFDAFLDSKDIVAGEPWRERLQGLISRANAVAFLISPDSIASEICDWEVNEAERLAKRILPVVIRVTPNDAIPGRLQRLNYVFLDNDANWSSEYLKLCDALKQDIRWVREHTRLSELAARWERDGRPDAQLLRLGEVLEARNNLEAGRPADASLGNLLIAFLAAGEEKEAQDRTRLLTITGRAFVNPAEQALDAGRYDAALRLAAAGALLSEDLDMALVPERKHGISRAVNLQALRCVLHGHEGAVQSAAFSPDGTRIVTASYDHTARLWDTSSGRELAVLRGHEGAVNSASFSLDGMRIITASRDSTTRLWDAASGREVAVLQGAQRRVDNASFTPDGTRVITASDDSTARLWDAASGREVAVLRGHEGRVKSASFSPDGTRIVTAAENAARVWDAASGRQIAVLRVHSRFVNVASFSPDSMRIVTISGARSVQVWDAASGRETASLRGHDKAVLRASFSPDGIRIVTASYDKTARLWDANSGREVTTLGHAHVVTDASFSFDGGRILTASYDHTACMWDAASGRELAVFRGHAFEVSSASFSPDGTRIVTTSWDRTSRMWDAACGREIVTLRGHESHVLRASFSSDGARIVTASDDKTARVWDANSGRELAVLRGHEGALKNASFTPDGTRVLTASGDSTARLWDAASGREVAVPQKSTDRADNALFSPDGTRIVTTSNDTTVRLCDADSGCEVTVLSRVPVRGVSFSPDGTRLVTVLRDSKIAQLWDAASGREMVALCGHERQVVRAAFSPDGTRIVTASIDRTARIWNVVSACELAVLRGHEEAVLDAVFSPDGMRVVTVAGDRTARVWDVGSTAVSASSEIIEALTASLANGRGLKSENERSDLLMQTAPEDMYSALLARLTPTQRAKVERCATAFARSRHPKCYLVPDLRVNQARAEAPVRSDAVHTPNETPAKKHATPRSQHPFGYFLPGAVILLLASAGVALWLLIAPFCCRLS
jgi:WD40 repeat protein